MLDFASEPVYDDYDENKKFYRILFRPSFAVQARELTQLQTILQKQIQRHGDNIFKQGAMVIPGNMSVDTKYDYVKLQEIYSGNIVDTYIDNLVGKTLIGASGITAQVLHVIKSDNVDPTTLYIRYTASATDTTTKVFADNEVIHTDDSIYYVQALATNSTGVGSAAVIERGVYYINGFFVLCDAQTIILDKYTNTPSYRVGLTIVESEITPEADESLLDNAQNSYNYAAPGSYRYHIDLILTKLVVGDSDTNFIELARTDTGTVAKQVRSTEYSVLEQTMARRTYDESGNYTVRPFEMDIREHRNNNRGQWLATTAYLIGDIVTNATHTYVAKNSGTSITTAPIHLSGDAYDGPGSTGIQWEYNEKPFYNRGIYLPENGGDESKLALGMEPGKAYVQGYELEKIATEYLAIDKSRQYIQTDNVVIPATLGNYTLITNLHSLPKFDTFETIKLYDRVTGSSGIGTAVGNQVGTARVRGIEWHNGIIGSTSAVYKLFLFDIKLNTNINFNKDVKSFYYDGGVGSIHDFTADINPVTSQLIGSVSSSSDVITGVGTSFLSDLTAGDYVYIDTQLRRVVGIDTQQSLTVDSALSPAVTGVTIKLVTNLLETKNDSLIFPLPNYAIKSVRSATDTNDNSYAVMQRFTGTTTSGGSLTLTTSSGTFASSAVTENYLAVDDSTGSVVAPVSITPAGGSVTLEFGSGYGSRSFIVSGTVNKTGATGTEKTKTLNTGTVTFTTAVTAQKTTLSLSKSDCYRIKSVKMDTGSFSVPTGSYTIDISDRYVFDDGQRDSYYDYGRLVLSTGFVAPSAPIQIVFEYFTHSVGDYFTVNSYPSNVDYKSIPTFNGQSLRDVFDFRPKIDDAGLTFSGTGASVTLMPKRGIDIRSDYTYYLARKDKIAIDFHGNFFDVTGISSLNPGDPGDPTLAMVLYDISLAPYTFSTSSTQVTPTKVDNKRYTMRDIGALDKRIDNLEYYTSLSLLEQETKSLSISDTSGFDRFKNGFIVDNFTGHNVGDVSSSDYMCSIDMANGELRPFFSMKNVNLIEKNSNDSDRNADNYKLFGDVIMSALDSTNPYVALITQGYASRTEYVNPFAVFTFIGDVKLNPSSDDWFEVNRAPDIVQNVEGNYNTVATMAQKAGVLGTVWNAWQTQWTGTPYATSARMVAVGGFSTQDFGLGTNVGADGAGIWNSRYNFTSQELQFLGGNATSYGQSAVGERVLTYTTYATQVGQARTGVNTSIVAKVDKQVVDDKVISTAVIPYIRSRNILIQTKGLKPNTKFYPFFDNIDISAYCTPASKITYTPVSGTFDDSTNIGGLSAEAARRIGGDSQVCLNIGDVITGAVSHATAVIVGKEYNISTTAYSLFVQNIIGTFNTGETITGSLSSAQGSVVSTVVNTIGSNIVTNLNGNVDLIFNIPNTDSVRFRTGSREFKLVDTSIADGAFTSRGRVNYEASGVLETKQATVVATRNAELVQETVTDNQVIIQSGGEKLSRDTGWYDPLAETFLIQSSGGAFLSQVDIYFASKDTAIPVTLELREVVNGYPGKRVLPFSRVTLKPEQVSISSNFVDLDGVATPKYDTPTAFKFPSPVYVQDNTEYCLVVMSDSNAYKVWISQMGDQIPGSTDTISQQPYAGVLFKSQNASTWTADQNQDMKFTIWRCKFDTNKVGYAEFVNDVLPKANLEFDPFQTVSGSNIIRVWHQNHNMPVGSSVLLSNTTATDIHGIPAVELYTTHIIANVDLDSYTITTTTNATSSGYAGGSTVYATENAQYDVVQPQVQVQTFSETKTKYTLKGVSGKSVDGSQTPYVIDAYSPECVVNDNNYLVAPKMISSEVNENINIGGNKSVTLGIQFSTTNDAISAVIDTHRCSLMLASNKINNPSETETNVSLLDDSLIFTGATGAFNFVGNGISSIEVAGGGTGYTPTAPSVIIAPPDQVGGIQAVAVAHVTGGIVDYVTITTKGSGYTVPPIVYFNGGSGSGAYIGRVIVKDSTIESTNSAVRAAMPSITQGTYITIANATSSGNDGKYLVTSVGDDGTNGIIGLGSVTFTQEASVSATSITQRILFVDEIAPIGSSTFSKYVSKQIKLVNPSSFLRIRLSANVPTGSELLVYYKTSPVGSIADFNNVNWTLITPDSAIINTDINSSTFYDIDYSDEGIVSFDTVSVKLVLQSSNTSAVPRVKDLRIIACA